MRWNWISRPHEGGQSLENICLAEQHGRPARAFFHDINWKWPKFRRFNGGSKARKAAAHDENGIGHPFDILLEGGQLFGPLGIKGFSPNKNGSSSASALAKGRPRGDAPIFRL